MRLIDEVFISAVICIFIKGFVYDFGTNNIMDLCL